LKRDLGESLKRDLEWEHLKQDVEQEIKSKLPPLIPSYFVFFATKKGTTTLLSLAFVFGFAVVKKGEGNKVVVTFSFNLSL
jgi:hypothetical protein